MFSAQRAVHGAYGIGNQPPKGYMDRAGWRKMLVPNEPSQDASVEPYVGVWGAGTSLGTAVHGAAGELALCTSRDNHAPCEDLMSFWADGRRKRRLIKFET